MNSQKQTGRAMRGRPQRVGAGLSMMATVAVMFAPARLAGRLATALPAADHGAAGRADLALVLEQARRHLGAIRNGIVAELVGVALAGVLRVLRAGIVGAL